MGTRPFGRLLKLPTVAYQEFGHLTDSLSQAGQPDHTARLLGLAIWPALPDAIPVTNNLSLVFDVFVRTETVIPCSK